MIKLSSLPDLPFFFLQIDFESSITTFSHYIRTQTLNNLNNVKNITCGSSSVLVPFEVGVVAAPPPFVSNVCESCDDNRVRGAGCGGIVGMPTVCVRVPLTFNGSDNCVGAVVLLVIVVSCFGSIVSPIERRYPV